MDAHLIDCLLYIYLITTNNRQQVISFRERQTQTILNGIVKKIETQTKP